MIQKYYLAILLLTIICLATQAQTISEINSDLGLEDDLTAEKELRIYKDRNIFNKSELVRIFRNDSSSWKIIFYEHWLPVNNHDSVKVKTTEIKVEKDMNLFWQELMITNIQYLPKMDDIRYKFRKNQTIVKRKGEYRIRYDSDIMFDGYVFTVILNNGEKSNQIIYSNPDVYLRNYPDVDEIIDFNNLLKAISSTLKIWQD